MAKTAGTKKYNFSEGSKSLNLPFILGVVAVIIVAVLVSFGVYHNRRNTTGDAIELSYPSIPVIDIFEDPLCPYCRILEQSSGGKAIAESALIGKAQVIYHMTNSLDRYSASKNYSSRAFASFLAIDNSSLIKKDKKKLWHDYHAALFSKELQPKEDAPTDLSNKQLANEIAKIAKTDGIILPVDLYTGVESGKYVKLATTKGQDNLKELHSRGVQGVPALWGNRKYYPLLDNTDRKKLEYQAKNDITKLEFLNNLAVEVSHISIPEIEVYEDPLCPMCGFYERTEGARALRDNIASGRIRVKYRLINYLDYGSASKDYSSRAVTALFDVYNSKLSIEDKRELWTDYHSVLFSEKIQPEESAVTDLSNKQLAGELVKVAANDSITLPADLVSTIESGDNVKNIKKISHGNMYVMQSHSITGTPTLWGKNKQYTMQIDQTGKTRAGTDPSDDIANPAFVETYINGRAANKTSTQQVPPATSKAG